MKQGKLLLFLFTYLVLPLTAFSAPVVIENPLQVDSFQELVERVSSYVFSFSLVVAVLAILIGAFFILTSGGDSKRLERGKNIILYTFLGLVIILFARGIVNLFKYLSSGGGGVTPEPKPYYKYPKTH